MKLLTIPHMAQKFQCPIGLSDHTLELAVPIAAVAFGACIIEKHLTLSRADGGPDRDFSLEPDEFACMVRAVRVAHAASGDVHYGGVEQEMAGRRFRRSLYAVRDIRRGETFTMENVRSIRPAGGLHPRHLTEVLGRVANADISQGTPLAWRHVD